MTNKGKITTAIGIVFLAGFIGILISYLFTDMGVDSFAVAATTWTAVCKFVSDYFTKDKNASHTKDMLGDIPPPGKEEK